MHNNIALPSALDEFDRIAEKLSGTKPVIFLDYDGTLAPIVNKPSQAFMPEDTRQTLDRLSKICEVAIVSGRDRIDVENFVLLDHLIYAGSHGFDIHGPDINMQLPEARDSLPALQHAAVAIGEKTRDIEGCQIENKKYAIAIHYRNVPQHREKEVFDATEKVVAQFPALKIGKGKKVLELKPDIDWHKGKAVLWLMQALDVPDNTVAVYIGDDITDEDAFQEIKQHNGIGILVDDHGEETAAVYRLENTGEVKEFLNKLYHLYSKFKNEHTATKKPL